MPPTELDLERQSTLREEDRTVYIPKNNCYALEMSFKELPDAIKGIPLELESAVNQQT